MKKLALALVFGVLSMGAVSAQTSEKTKVKADRKEMKVKQERTVKGKGHQGKGEAKSPEERAERRTKAMTEQLGLSNDQAARIKTLNLNKARQMQELKAKYGEDRKGMGTEMKAVKYTWNTELKNILSAEQYTKYETQQKERKAKMKARHADGKGRGKGKFKKEIQK